jgi:hypothetical protein
VPKIPSSFTGSFSPTSHSDACNCVSTISIGNKCVTHQSIMNDMEHKNVVPSISSTRSHNSFLSGQVGHLETKRKLVFEPKSFCNRIQKRRSSSNLSAARNGSLVNWLRENPLGPTCNLASLPNHSPKIGSTCWSAFLIWTSSYNYNVPLKRTSEEW